MKQVILDTSFIITAVAQKVDFFDEIEGKGLHVLVPEQAIKELKSLGAELALRILDKNKFETLKISGKDADSAIINFARKNPSAIVATLDRGLQGKVRNSKMVIRGRKKLEII